MSTKKPTLICMSSYFKGEQFMISAKQAGCRVILLTEEKFANKAWPWESIDEKYFMPDLANKQDVLNGISYLARTEQIDQIVALDDFDVETAAYVREHLRLSGIGDSLARHFRDKLAMRTQAQACGLNVPPFCGIINHDKIRQFMNDVPAPWVLKPRSEAATAGIKKIHSPEELWPWLEKYGDRQSHYLLEKFIPGEVYHVDGLTVNGKVLFSIASKYGRPPMEVTNKGGVFISRNLSAKDPDSVALLKFNKEILKCLGMQNGVNHTEYIKGTDGQFYFLETASRVGGANLADMIDAASGFNLWAEWAKLENAIICGEKYKLPKIRKEYAGIIVCLSHQEEPDISSYDAPEIVWRMNKKNHAGMIIRSTDAKRVEELLNEYVPRFAEDFLAFMPPLESAADMVD